MTRSLAPLLSLALTLLPAPACAGLLDYIAKPEPAFAWRLVTSTNGPDGNVHELRLVSQTWRGIEWSHDLHLYIPNRLETPSTVLLSVTGEVRDRRALYLRVASETGAPVAVLHQIPNQPLLDGKYEDDLIAETFLRFLTSGEEDWPLLLPMTKSVVKAMDAVQAYARAELSLPVDGFVLTGASKRGWASWLAAAADARVKGVAPLVIDMLNIPAQMPHQLASWGSYSEMLEPYTAPGLPSLVATDAGRGLLSMVDPYAYRERLDMPKLIVLGTNDRYWTLDALNLYWDDLPGRKHLVYVPNMGHSLGGGRWLGTLACFVRQVAGGERAPEFRWSHERAGDQLRLAVNSDEPIEGAMLWWASAPDRDFRSATWEARPIYQVTTSTQAALPVSAEHFMAAFLELRYKQNGRDCHYSTQVHIEPPAAH